MNPRNGPFVPAPALLHTSVTSAVGPSPLATGDWKSQLHTHLPRASRSPEVIGARNKWSRKWSFIGKYMREASQVWAPWRKGRMGSVGEGSATGTRICIPGASQVQREQTPPGRRKENQRCDSAGQRLRGSGRQDQAHSSSLSGRDPSISPSPPYVLSPTNLGSLSTAQPFCAFTGHLFLPPVLTSQRIHTVSPAIAHTALHSPRAISITQTFVRGIYHGALDLNLGAEAKLIGGCDFDWILSFD